MLKSLKRTKVTFLDFEKRKRHKTNNL